MKAKLEFDLPEESNEHNDALNGTKYKLIISEILEWLRSTLKHSPPQDWPTLDDVKREIHSRLAQEGLTLD